MVCKVDIVIVKTIRLNLMKCKHDLVTPILHVLMVRKLFNFWDFLTFLQSEKGFYKNIVPSSIPVRFFEYSLLYSTLLITLQPSKLHFLRFLAHVATTPPQPPPTITPITTTPLTTIVLTTPTTTPIIPCKLSFFKYKYAIFSIWVFHHLEFMLFVYVNVMETSSTAYC